MYIYVLVVAYMDFLFAVCVRNSKLCVRLATAAIASAVLAESRTVKAHGDSSALIFFIFCRVTVPDIDAGNAPFFVNGSRGRAPE